MTVRYRLAFEFVVGLADAALVAVPGSGADTVYVAKAALPAEALTWYLPITLLPCPLAHLPA